MKIDHMKKCFRCGGRALYYWMFNADICEDCNYEWKHRGLNKVTGEYQK